MTDSLIMHPFSRSQLTSFRGHPGHLLLITGPDGTGKSAIARELLGSILNIETSTLYLNPNILFILPENKSISIDTIRELHRFLRLKSAGKSQFRRGIVVEHAQYLTPEAQNALLKTLEEPPEDTIIILTVQSTLDLRPTIVSRSQIINIKKPLQQDVFNHFKDSNKYIDPAIAQADRLSGGLPGLMTALLEKDSDHTLVSTVQTAKKILELNRLDRIMLIPEISKDKAKVSELIEALIRIATASLSQTAKFGNTVNMKRWYNILRLTLAAQKDLAHNANSKLLLTNLFLNI